MKADVFGAAINVVIDLLIAKTLYYLNIIRCSFYQLQLFTQVIIPKLLTSKHSVFTNSAKKALSQIFREIK